MRQLVVTVRQQQEKGGLSGLRADIRDQLRRRFALCRAAGVIRSGDDERVFSAPEHAPVILQHRHAAGAHLRQNAAQAGHAPFVIARHIIHGGNGTQTAQQRRQHGKVRVLVKQIAVDADKVRLRPAHGRKQAAAAPAEHAAVQVSQLHDAKPVERGRQGRGDECGLGRLQAAVSPQQESGGKQGRQHEQDGGFPAAHGGFLPFKSFFAQLYCMPEKSLL